MPARKSTAPKPEKNKSLEQWIWDAACSIRGAKDAIEKVFSQDQWAWGAHLRRAQRARRVRQRRKLPNQYVADTWAMACMNMIIHDMEGTIEIGDTFKNPKFRDKRGKLRTFDRVVATAQRGSAFSLAKPHRRASRREDNPMWNQDWFTEADYDADELDRFPAGAGFPGKSSADCPPKYGRPAGSLRCASENVGAANAAGQWGWTQHIFSSLKPDGRAAVVWDTGAVSRGSGNAGDNKEKTVRQWFVERDLVESVLYLPEPSGASQTARQGRPQGERGGANQNLFYNTSAPGIVLFLHAAKPKARQGKVFLVNASQIFEKGNPKNFIPDDGIQRIADTLSGWQEEEKLSRIVGYTAA